MDRPCARRPFGAAPASAKMDDSTRALHRHGRRSRSRRMCGSVSVLLRGQTDGTLLRSANQARLAISARAVELLDFRGAVVCPWNCILNETDLSFFNPWCQKMLAREDSSGESFVPVY